MLREGGTRQVPGGSFKTGSNFTWLSSSLVPPSGHCLPSELCTVAASLGTRSGMQTVARSVGVHSIRVLWGEWTRRILD